MHHNETALLICSSASTTPLWAARWSPLDTALTVSPCPVSADGAFSAHADPVSGRIVVATLTTTPELISLRPIPGEIGLKILDRISLKDVVHACRVRVDRTGHLVAIAGYTSGTVTIASLSSGAASSTEPQTLQFTGIGPDPVRQDHSYIHDVLFDPHEDDVLLATDLGADLIRRIRISTLAEEAGVTCRPGSGPRHAAWVGRNLVVTGELDSTIMLISPSANRELALSDTVDATSRRVSDRNYPSSIVTNPRNGLVYAANRGADTILTAAVIDGRLETINEIDSTGVRPEQLALIGDHLLVAHSGDGEVAALDLRGGVPTGDVTARAHVPGAMWIEPLPTV